MSWNTILMGLGRIAWQLELDQKRYHPCTHAGTLKALSNHFQLIGICDRNQNKITNFLNWWDENNNSIQIATDYKELLKNIKQNIDFAIVTTGPESHIEILKALIHYPVKTILIEKPLSFYSRDVLEILELKKTFHTHIYVNFERRYHQNYKKVKEIIDRNIFGPLLNIQGRVLAPSIKRDPLLEDAIHWLDLVLWYIGEPEILYSYWEWNELHIEKRSLHILKKDEVLIQLESGGKRSYFEFIMNLDFEKGRIEIGNHVFKLYRKSLSKRYEKFFELREIPIQIKFINPWLEMYQSIYTLSPDNLYDAYLGIKLYEELKKLKN